MWYEVDVGDESLMVILRYFEYSVCGSFKGGNEIYLLFSRVRELRVR